MTSISVTLFLYILLAASMASTSFTIKGMEKQNLHAQLPAFPEVVSAGSEPADPGPVHSLAGDYLVTCSSSDNTISMKFTKLSRLDVNESFSHSQGAQAWACLHGLSMERTIDDSDFRISADLTKNPPLLAIHNEEGVAEDFVHVMVRVLAQWTLRQLPATGEIQLPDGTIYSTAKFSCSDIKDIFECQGEVVEMVDSYGAVLGRVPRPLVHKHNLLHRGIGLFVTNSTALHSADSPESFWYVHRRTSTKRIFPNLYDMFVGGISLADENDRTTALREVKEELGLDKGRLSDALLTCIVCTDYNRCFVTLFAYSTNPDEESVRWQEEEVAWGDFCPYPVIKAAADRSIQRLRARNAWPGQLPSIQSELNGTLTDDTLASDGWRDWDFVPDGLLVWEAWLKYRQNRSERA